MTREQDFRRRLVQRFAAGVVVGSTVATGAAYAAEQNGHLDTITVTSTAIETAGNTPPPTYAGGQVAAGGRLGILGEQDAMNVPFNVISYTDELIENQQADTIGDVLQNDASVAVGTGFGNYSESFKIRGFNLYNDDISFGGLYGVLPRQIVASDIASRVELFKGASAFANGVPAGGTGVGGSVNIEPKRATDEPINRLSTGYTSDGYIDSGVDVGRRFGEANEFGARLVLKRGRGDTVIDDAERENTLALLGLDYDGGSDRLSFDLGHQKTVVDGDRLNLNLGSYTGSSVPDVPHSDANYVPGWNRSSLETTFAMVRGEHDFNDDWTGYAALGGNRTHERTLSGSVSLSDEAGDGTVSQLDTAYQSESLASQIGLRGKLDTGPVSHQLNLGYSSVYSRKDVAFEYPNTDPASSLALYPAPATNLYDPVAVDQRPNNVAFGNVGDPNTTGRVYNNGVSLSDTLGFIDDRLLLTLGARYQEIEVNNYGAADGVLTDRFAASRVTPVYGLLYKATDNISLYANHIEALQAGESAPFTNGDNTVTNAGDVLGIVRSKQDEVGAKFDYGTIGGGIALFQIEQPQVTIDSTNTAGYDGEQRNRGLETSLYGEPLEGVRLLASATWMDPELRDTTDGTNDGNDAPGVAGYRYVLGGEWDLPKVQNLTATGRVIRTGAQYVDEANDLKVDPWTRLDLGLRYTMPFNEGNLIWRADVENVTDEAYWASAATTGSQTLWQGEPRTFKLSATLDF